MRVLLKFIVLDDQGEVVQGLEVVVKASFQLVLVRLHGILHGLGVDDKVERQQHNDNPDGRQAVTPDVHTFIMDHEEAPQYLFRGVKVDAIAMGDIVVILHLVRGSLVVSDVVLPMQSRLLL